MEKFHSIQLLEDRCIGCTDCIKRCPTEAIRVRNGKAVIIDERCIDCGNCIRVCRNHAKVASTDTVESMKDYKVKVAIPAPTLYGQFANVDNVNQILTALKYQGFDDVFEVALAAELVSKYSMEYCESHKRVDNMPFISSACPAVVRTIAMRFPSLIDYVLPVLSPVEVAAESARVHYMDKGYTSEEIGVFFITPCAAKATYAEDPIGIDKSNIDGAISIRDLYIPMLATLKKLDGKEEKLAASGAHGINWALSGGESQHFQADNVIAVDGIENVVDVLEKLENGQIENVSFIEGLACNGGCVGGPLTVENGYLASNYMRRVIQATKDKAPEEMRKIDVPASRLHLDFTCELEPTEAMSLDENIEEAMKKLELINRTHEKLPEIDCGSCGAPTCYALAEDIVQGRARVEDCVFLFKEQFLDLSENMMDLVDSAISSQMNHIKVDEEDET